MDYDECYKSFDMVTLLQLPHLKSTLKSLAELLEVFLPSCDDHSSADN